MILSISIFSFAFLIFHYRFKLDIFSNASNGTLTLSMAANTTANIDSGSYYYDLQETNSTVITTLMGGKVTIIGDVSNV